MAAEKEDRLARAIDAIHDKWGTGAIQRLGKREGAPVAHVPTGFAALDAALGIGGVPCGRITELIGAPTSGMATLALHLVGQAQATAGLVAYIDPARLFDPDYAARCGVDLGQLLLAHPRDERQALNLVHDFARGGGLSALVLDTPLSQPAGSLLADTLDQIIAPLAKSACVFLCLTPLPTGGRGQSDYPQGVALPHYAAVRLLVRREQWLYRKRDIHGYRARVEVVKNKLGPAGRTTTIDLVHAVTPESLP